MHARMKNQMIQKKKAIELISRPIIGWGCGTVNPHIAITGATNACVCIGKHQVSQNPRSTSWASFQQSSSTKSPRDVVAGRAGAKVPLITTTSVNQNALITRVFAKTSAVATVWSASSKTDYSESKSATTGAWSLYCHASGKD